MARVPGHIHTDLLAHRLIEDPYGPMAEADQQWIGLARWEYRCGFDLQAAELKRAASDLVLDGLDTFADVHLNGERLVSTDNAFRSWRLPVRERLKPRGNELLVIFHSPILRVLPQVQAMKPRLRGNYPSPFGDEPKDALTGNFVRKPGYHYGWDWGPRYVTAGIWHEVRLESFDGLRLADVHVKQRRLADDVAELEIAVEIDARRAGSTATLFIDVTDPKGRRLSPVRQSVAIAAGTNRYELPYRIQRPLRWYPAGYGEQALYAVRVRVEDSMGAQVELRRRIGLRTVELRRDRDEWGQGFAFVINGIPMFAKGANVIPLDMFPNRVSTAALRRVLQSARDANMNMLRNWGGGYYESEAFFDLADELGLMIWQDFMFGGGVVPAYDPTFRANVIAEANQQVRRLRHHPSIVLWCGNNELETAWKDWGIGKEMIDADAEFARTVWSGYEQLFGVELREVAAREAGVPYWSSSPSNDLTDKANDSSNGDKHYWDVWVGRKPVEEYARETPRFMSEFGLQAWPVQATIDRFATRDAQLVDGPVIRAHQKFLAGAGNDRILHYLREGYGDPASFSDFAYLSQVFQAEGISLAALHHRASRPRTMGTLYWQLNDVWPGASWSSIDYFGRWKALHWHIRRAFQPIAVAALRLDARTRVTVVSDSLTPSRGELRLRVMDLEGRVLRDERQPVEIAPGAATLVNEYPDETLLGRSDPARTVAVVDLIVGGRSISRGEVYFAPAKSLALRKDAVTASIRPDVKHQRIDLTAKHFVRGLWLDFGDLDVELSDNALTLLPGERVSVQVRGRATTDELRRRLTLRSLADVIR